METLERVSGTLRVLAHPVRLKLVELLMAGEVPVHELAEAIDLAPAAVSQHLNLMKAHGVLTSRREGRLVLYRVVAPEAVTVLGCIRKHHG